MTIHHTILDRICLRPDNLRPLVLGVAKKGEREPIPIELAVADLSWSMLVIGRAGSGKPRWLQYLFRELMYSQVGAMVLDFDGELVSSLRNGEGAFVFNPCYNPPGEISDSQQIDVVELLIDDTNIATLDEMLSNHESGVDLHTLIHRQAIVFVRLNLPEYLKVEASTLVLEHLIHAAHKRVTDTNSGGVPLWPVFIDGADALIKTNPEVLINMLRVGRSMRIPTVVALRSWPETTAPALIHNVGHQVVFDLEDHDRDSVGRWFAAQGINADRLSQMARGDLFIKLHSSDEVVHAYAPTGALWLQYAVKRFLEQGGDGVMGLREYIEQGGNVFLDAKGDDGRYAPPETADEHP